MRSFTIIKSKLFSGFFKQCTAILFICIIISVFLPFISQAKPATSNRVVRVGFFEFEGYHDTDNQNQRSGYGYEYLHEMAKYAGWTFEYIDGTWEECQEMLKNGTIDLLTSAQYSISRDDLFDFSSTSMGTSYAQLTVLANNIAYGRNDFAQFNDIHIGLLKGNSRNDSLSEFAIEKGFTYRTTMYESQDELNNALQAGAVDAALTSSLRKLTNESIIAQFAPSPFYTIVKDGNESLLQEVNFALDAIEMNSPAFRYNLYQEFYRVDTTDTFVLSREEKEYLETKPTIRAVIRPDVAPISYWENGNFQGVSADVIAHLLSDLDIQIEYIRPNTLVESYEMLLNGDAEISCLFESDYNLAEQYHTRITAPYFETNYSLISRKHNSQAVQEHPIIAVAQGGLVGIDYVKSHYSNAQQLPVESTGAAISAVAQGHADFALVNVYSTEKELANYPNLRASFISDEEQQFSIGVSQSVDPRLYSILDKKITAMSDQVFNDILSKHTMFQQTPMSLSTYFRQNPLAFLLLSIAIFTIIIGVLLYIIVVNKRHAKNIYNLAYIDPLTNLWNSNGFLLHGKTLLAKNSDSSFIVAAIDLSDFSGINEDYSRLVGDKVIEKMGHILKHYNNEQLLVGHSEADRFLILLNYKNQVDIDSTLTTITELLSFFKIDDLHLRLQAYIGVGFITSKSDNLLQAVDHAIIARNRCSSEQPIIYMDKTLQESLLREKDIRDHTETALEQGEFQVFYQPKVNMSTMEIVGAEALIRWNHGKLGFLNPSDFLPILEENGLITEIDFFVLEQTCKLIRKWIDAGQKPIIISVNQSRTHFLKENYIDRLQNMIAQYNIPPNHIELEITETLFGQESISNTIIKKIKSLGLLISIDDFGSGYSSLHLLHQISVDILKIDRGLLNESGIQKKMRNIIHRIVQIATDLDVDVICEGVETKEQMKFLLEINCKYAQGFLFSKPLPQPTFELLIQRNTTMDLL